MELTDEEIQHEHTRKRADESYCLNSKDGRIRFSLDGRKVLITYSGMARNLALNADLFNVKWPKGTEIVKK